MTSTDYGLICDGCGKTQAEFPDLSWRAFCIDVPQSVEPNRGYRLGDERHACCDKCEQRIKLGAKLNMKMLVVK